MFSWDLDLFVRRDALEAGFDASRKRRPDTATSGPSQPAAKRRGLLDSVFPGLSDTSSSESSEHDKPESS